MSLGIHGDLDKWLRTQIAEVKTEAPPHYTNDMVVRHEFGQKSQAEAYLKTLRKLIRLTEWYEG